MIIKYRDSNDKIELLELLSSAMKHSKLERSKELFEKLYNAVYMAKEGETVKEKVKRISEANKVDVGERTAMPQSMREIIATKQYLGE